MRPYGRRATENAESVPSREAASPMERQAETCTMHALLAMFAIGLPYVKRFADGETDWVVSMIPLGGYVKMLDEREGEVAPDELDRAFNRQPLLRRMAIVVAGPVANLLLAIILYFALFTHGVPGVKPILGEVLPSTPAAVAQLHARETIISINGKATPSWQEVRWSLLDLVLQKRAANLEILDVDGSSFSRMLETTSLTPADLDGDFIKKLGLQTYQPPIYPVIDKITEGSPAHHAGLQSRDKILSVNGQAILHWDDFVAVVRGHPASALNVEVEREGHTVTLMITPDSISADGKQIGRGPGYPGFRFCGPPLLSEGDRPY